MELGPILLVVSVLSLGVGFLLILKNRRGLSRRAKELDMWPTLHDTPPQPWTIYPEWSFALYFALFRGTSQRDEIYRTFQRRMRLGFFLCAIGFAGAVVLVKVVDK